MSDLPPGVRPGSAPFEGEPDWAALARTWAGEPSGASAEANAEANAEAGDEAARRWLAAHPDEAARLAALDRLVAERLTPPLDRSPVDVEAALARVTARRLAQSEPRSARTVTPVGPRRVPAPVPAWSARPAAPRWRPRVLAGGALAAGLAAVIVTVVARRGGDASGPEVTAGAAGAERRYATAVGQRDSVRLPDGTRVVLGAASTMTVPADYGATTRTVVLDGEAYFHAEHDAVRPFVVRVGPAAVHDLGTAFTVRHGPDVADGRGRVAVTVTEGAVRLAAVDLAPTPGPVAARDSGIVLRAGERGVVAPVPGRGFAAARVDGSATAVADDTAWTSGRLVFRDAPLVEVAGALRRWYGVELRVADPTLARRHLTATFRGEPLPEVLRVVGLALGARVDRRGDTVVVRPAR